MGSHSYSHGTLSYDGEKMRNEMEQFTTIVSFYLSLQVIFLFYQRFSHKLVLYSRTVYIILQLQKFLRKLVWFIVEYFLWACRCLQFRNFLHLFHRKRAYLLMGSGVPDADLCDNQCRIKLQSSQVYIINYVDQWSYCNPIPHTGCIGRLHWPRIWKRDSEVSWMCYTHLIYVWRIYELNIIIN